MELAVEQLLLKIKELENRLDESDQLIEAIKAGEVDAFALNKNNQSEIYTLQSGDYAYRMLVENFGEGALNLSDESLIVYTNNYFLNLLSLPYDAVIGKSFFQFIHPGSKETFNQLFKKGLTSQSKGEINLLVGEKTIPVYVSLTTLYPKLPTVGMIVTDLTEKRKHEKMLVEINEVLKLSEERYHRMVAEVQDYAIILLNKEGIIQNWNKGAENIKGYKAEEIIGKSFSEFYTAEARENHVPEKLLALAREKGKATDENWRLRKDGSRFWGSVVITALRDDDHKIVGFVKVTRDLTEKKDAEDKLKLNASLLAQKNIDLEKMNKELQSFAYVSSHDLQEPLRKIQTFSTRILEKEENNLSDNGKDNFKRMQAAANRMQKLIDDLLVYSRTNTGERKYEITDLNKIIDEVKEDLREDIKDKHATIEATELCEANIIPFQFRQVMNNLIGNSLKFSNPEQPPRIIIKSETVKGAQLNNDMVSKENIYCHISVSDNGIGFEPEYREKIFEVFQRLHGKSEYSGTGIGLSIVKKIVENHNGIITAHGEPNKGATFDIYFPT